MLKAAFLTAVVSLGLIACGGDEFPVDYVYIVDIPHSVCAKYKIADKKKLIFVWDSDLPLVECDGNVSLAKDDWPVVRDWIRAQLAKPQCPQSVANP